MMDETKFAGICENCKHAIDCRYREGQKTPILFCEEYECFTEVEPTNIDDVREENFNSTYTTEGKTYKGLCENCKHRETCKIIKPEGGIWHCEEYE